MPGTERPLLVAELIIRLLCHCQKLIVAEDWGEGGTSLLSRLKCSVISANLLSASFSNKWIHSHRIRHHRAKASTSFCDLHLPPSGSMSPSRDSVNTRKWSSWVYKTIVFCLCPACAAYGSFHGCWRAWLMGRGAVGLVFLMCSTWQGESEALGEVTRGKSGYIGAGGRRRFHQTATEGSHLCQITLQAQKMVSKRRFYALGFLIFWRRLFEVQTRRCC